MKLTRRAKGVTFVVSQSDTFEDIIIADSAIKGPLVVKGGRLWSTPLELVPTGLEGYQFLTFVSASANQGFLHVILVGKSSLRELGFYANASLGRDGTLVAHSLAKWMDGKVPVRYGPNTRVRISYRFDRKRRAFVMVGRHFGKSRPFN